ncbi:hypothetical protein A2U01_0072333, partial [Trifolium medium]|nr:hypothetical protein [Trifolium medium]
MARQGTSAIRGNRGNRGSRSPTPPRHDNNSPLRSPDGSDEEATRCPFSQDIMRAPIPSGFDKPLPLGTYDGKT